MRLFALTLALSLAACKPPPGDAAMERELPGEEPVFASLPLPSPETEGAIWAPSQKEGRILYGVPQEPALIALECLNDGSEPLVQITRMAAADEGAGALLALVGNGAIGRIEVDATKIGTRIEWQGAIAPSDRNIEPLSGPRKVTATIPGAGMVELNPSPLPGLFLEACKIGEPLAPMLADEPQVENEKEAEIGLSQEPEDEADDVGTKDEPEPAASPLP
ncbi:MAG: hypothetical protein AAGK17_01585 [Pseudomonadota bacterium]